MIYIATNKDNKDALMHYGVQGMKWRRRKWAGDESATGQENNIKLMANKIVRNDVQNHGNPKNVFQFLRTYKRVTSKAAEQGSKHYTKRKTTNGNLKVSSGYKGKTGRELKNGHSSTNARRGGWSKEYLQTLHYNKKRNKYFN
jgi:hypothetical protein